MKKTILNIAKFSAVVATLSLFSCHKKTEDPTPAPTPAIVTDTTKKNPVVVTPIDTTKKDSVIVPKDTVVVPVTKKLNFTPVDQILKADGADNGFLLTPMVESDSIYTVEVVSSSSDFTTFVNPNGQIGLTPPNKVYAGKTVLTITLKSGKRSVTKQINVSYGNDKQIATYEKLKPVFGFTLLRSANGTTNMVINTDGTIKSNANGNFYGNNSGTTHDTYIINDSGNINLIGSNVEYKITSSTSSSNYVLMFTNNNGVVFTQYK